MSPIAFIHISGAVVGLLSGFLAMAVRKGSGWHGAAGTVFFVSMLTMSGAAAISAAFLKVDAMNLIAGLLTFYLVATGWWAIKRSPGTSRIDIAGLAFVTIIAIAAFRFGFEAAFSTGAIKDHMPAPGYFVFGSFAWIFAASDVRMVVRGGLTGARKLARHLWRMGLALMIALGSFFPGQARIFPREVRANTLLYVPHVLIAGSLFLWLYRVSRRKPVVPMPPSDREPAALTPNTSR